jgi:hypothetical protein
MPPVSRLAAGRSHNKPVTTTPLGAKSVHVGFGQQIWHVAFRFSHAWRISLASMITGVNSSPRERGEGGCWSKRLCSVSTSVTMVIVAADHCCALRLLSQNGFSALSLRASLKRAISRTQCSAWLECLRSRVLEPLRLRLEAPCRVAIALVAFRKRKRRQPGLAAHGPEFVSGCQLVGRIQGSQIDLDLVRAAPEHR